MKLETASFWSSGRDDSYCFCNGMYALERFPGQHFFREFAIEKVLDRQHKIDGIQGSQTGVVEIVGVIQGRHVDGELAAFSKRLPDALDQIGTVFHVELQILVPCRGFYPGTAKYYR